MQKITSAESVGHAAFAEGCTRDELLLATQTAASAVILIAKDAPTHDSKMRMLRAMTALLASTLLEAEPAELHEQEDRLMDHRSEQKHRRRTLIVWTCFIAACAVATFVIWKLSGRAI